MEFVLFRCVPKIDWARRSVSLMPLQIDLSIRRSVRFDPKVEVNNDIYILIEVVLLPH